MDNKKVVIGNMADNYRGGVINYNLVVLRQAYDFRKKWTRLYKYRVLGMMEAYLHILGKMEPGKSYEFLKVKKAFRLLWFIPIHYTRQESYAEMIRRNVEEFYEV